MTSKARFPVRLRHVGVAVAVFGVSGWLRYGSGGFWWLLWRVFLGLVGVA